MLFRALDFTPGNLDSYDSKIPVIVVLHGLTGGRSLHWWIFYCLTIPAGSYESYVRSILAPACTPASYGGLGYRAVVVNFRGCELCNLVVF
jgi:predicted alpha/beta-fold hydrolase